MILLGKFVTGSLEGKRHFKCNQKAVLEIVFFTYQRVENELIFIFHVDHRNAI